MTATEWSLYSSDVVGIIASFLHCKDAIKLCYLNKTFYAIFLIPVIRHSFVSINTDHIAKLRNSNIFHIFNTMNLYIDGLKKLREPIFLYIERLLVAPNSQTKWANLRYISFGKSFNRKIDVLPTNIEEIGFHPKSVFNQKITQLNCNNLKRIYFGKSFNQKIDFLPSGVEIIHFIDTARFDKPIRHAPAALKEIYFGQWFNHDLDGLWATAKSLNRLQFATRSIFTHDIRPSATLQILSLGMYYNRELYIQNTKLDTLRFHKLSRYNQELILPNTLQLLVIGEFFNKCLNLQEIKIIRFYAKARFNQPLYIPITCHTAIIGRYFTAKLTGGQYLKTLKFAKFARYKSMDNLLEMSKNKQLQIVHSGFIQNQEHSST